ncbi:MAG: hypothetical protein QXV35_04795 [Archaeoglobaceae archaeon]
MRIYESAFSTFKRTFNDYRTAKKLTNIAKELAIKHLSITPIINTKTQY